MIAKRIFSNLPGFRGHASLYRMSPPLEGHEYVIASTADVPLDGIETYLFPANADGKVTNWLELDGSRRGIRTHSEVFRGIGYQIES